MKKQLSILLAAVMAMSLTAGCTGGKGSTDGKVEISVGRWPDKEVDQTYYENMEKRRTDFMAENENITVTGDQYAFDVQSFMAKAEGGTLPTIFNTFMTETKKISELGYVESLTKQMKENGFYDNINDYILDKISMDGEVYFIPENVYSLGIVINLDIYEKAGFVDSEGNPYVPETFEDLARVAKEIREKTGVAGFAMPTNENVGGWNFMPIAWAYGTEFMKQNGDKWESTFASEECAQALELLKKMKWEDNSLPESTLINATEAIKLVATGQAAMTMAHPNQVGQLKSYGLDINSVGMIKMPAGPEKHVTLIGGDVLGIPKGSTQEQIDAAFKWEEYSGISYSLTDAGKESILAGYEKKKSDGTLIGIKDLSIWKDSSERQKFVNETIDANININPNHIKSYNDKDGIDYQVEEPVCTQDLYKLLDGCIQEVLTNKDADCAALLKTASETFQSNFLDYE